MSVPTQLGRTFLLGALAIEPQFCQAQGCEPGWETPGAVDGLIHAATLWDPDGAGPDAPVFVVGGRFATASGVAAARIAAWDPATGEWESLGGGVSGTVLSLAALASGDLVAGGYFDSAGGVEANGIARWDGRTWHAMGGGVRGDPLWWLAPGVYALLALPGGDLIAAGYFQTAGGIAAESVARWDGDQWSAMGALFAVRDLALLPSGEVVAGTIDHVARWDGVDWRVLGGPMLGGPGTEGLRGVFAVHPLASGELVAGGYFTLAGGTAANRIARWDGAAWAPLASGVDGFIPGVFALATAQNGDLIAAGRFLSAGGESANNIARWDGAQWRPLGDGVDDWAEALAASEDHVIVGGNFATAGGAPSPHVARWRECGCYADCDASGELDLFDFLCFQNLFAAADPIADCDLSGELDLFDFLCFQNDFAAGCP